MSIAGDSSRWADLFPEHLVPDVLLLIVETWAAFDKPTDGELEEEITRRFRRELGTRNRHTEAVPVRIDREVWTDGTPRGRVDIRFTHGYSDKEYLAFEAKKLNRPKLSNADQYVGCEGMERFITGKYGPGQKHGGMIGYVMDGDCNKAVKSVRSRIAGKRSALGMKPRATLRRSNLFAESRHVYKTHHRVAKRRMTLHHVLLAA